MTQLCHPSSGSLRFLRHIFLTAAMGQDFLIVQKYCTEASFGLCFLSPITPKGTLFPLQVVIWGLSVVLGWVSPLPPVCSTPLPLLVRSSSSSFHPLGNFRPPGHLKKPFVASQGTALGSPSVWGSEPHVLPCKHRGRRNSPSFVGEVFSCCNSYRVFLLHELL